jgi:ribosome-interacting GTPase 1
MSEKVEERIKELEERLASTKVNKATQKSINFLKAQLAKNREFQKRGWWWLWR